MRELVCNLHIHSNYSDGSGRYAEIASAALSRNVDVVIMTDHNILVKNVDSYYTHGNKKLLFLTGEEVHDQSREPQKNHTLVIGAQRELAEYAYDSQKLFDEAKKAGGLTFLAHPNEFGLPLFREPDISWETWDVENFTGLELWNGFSEFKAVSRTFAKTLFYAFFPEFMAHSPHPKTIQKWDELLTVGQRVYAVGGSDAHAIHFRYGFFKKTIFPYEFHFSTINNHLLIHDALDGDIPHDREIVYKALRQGNSYIGYDLPASTSGFSFSIENNELTAQMGETINIDNGGTVRIKSPQRTVITLTHNGNRIVTTGISDRLIYTVTEPGYYRVECSINFLGQERGWIYSNPIFCTRKSK
jgi:hypothetical protein